MAEQPFLTKGRYVVRLAGCERDIAQAQALRGLAFGIGAQDCDSFDAACHHFLIYARKGGELVGCFRLLDICDGAGVVHSYSAQFYDLSALSGFRGRMGEVGRFCLRPGWDDPDIVRLAWAAMTAHVDETGIEMLFGCASFLGTEAGRYLDAFAILRARHLAPERWLPGVKAPDVFAFGDRRARPPDLGKAMASMPSLLRSYLAMGGWVSDHAVVDHAMNTLHVFTGLEIGAIPPARKRLLRGLAG